MEQLLQRIPLVVSLLTALAFVLSVVYDLAFFAKFDLSFFRMMTISDHVASGLDFLVPFASIMLLIGCYLLVSETLRTIAGSPLVRNFLTYLQGYEGTFKWAADLLRFFIEMILIWDASLVPSLLLFYSAITLQYAIPLGSHATFAVFAVYLIVGLFIGMFSAAMARRYTGSSYWGWIFEHHHG